MHVVISYDVAVTTETGPRRLRQMATACLDYGKRVQFSVFECSVERVQWVVLRARLLDIMDPHKDSLRFYYLGENPVDRIEHHGAKVPVDFDGPLIV